jgi:hypothetical protein
MFQKDIRILAQKLKKAYAKVRLIESADISTKVSFPCPKHLAEMEHHSNFDCLRSLE